jgi:hypothetical protein
MGKRLKDLAWYVTPVQGNIPLLALGRVDTYTSFAGRLYYFGGPALLLNCACDNHSNTSLCLGRQPPKQYSCAKVTNDVNRQDELVVCYGNLSSSFPCRLCGKLTPAIRRESFDHAPVHPSLIDTVSREAAISVYISCFHKEADMLEQAIKQLDI